MHTERDVIVIGSGPAGLTAALYAARANLKPLVIEGIEAGGQLMLTTLVENWPGYRDGIMGPDLMGEMRVQAERFGAEILQGDVSSVDLSRRPFLVTVGSTQYLARTLIIATGASAKWLELGVDRKLAGRGVSTCATCDGYFFKSRPVAVIGGGDTAMEEAIYLSKLASSVVVIHRRDELRASKVMQDKAFSTPNISFVWNTEVVDIRDLERGTVTGLVLRNNVTGDTSELAVDASSSASATCRTRACSRGSSICTTTATSAPIMGRARACLACSRRETCRITSIGRRSPPPDPAAWPRSMPNASCQVWATRRPRRRNRPRKSKDVERGGSEGPPLHFQSQL